MACTLRACVDSGPPQVCSLADGRTIAVGEVYGDTCSRCYCAPNGMLTCTGRPCVDAGPPVPPDDGSGCNTLSVAGVAAPGVSFFNEAPPVPSGGTILDGTYYLAKISVYGLTGPMAPAIGRTVAQISRGVVQMAMENGNRTSVQHTTHWFMTNRAVFSVVTVCGSSSGLTAVPYSASPVSFSLYTNTSPVTILTFARQ